MAPTNPPAPDIPVVQENIQNILSDLLTLLSQTTHYDTAGRPTRDTLASDLQTLVSSLQAANRAALALGPDPGVPETLIHYVENGRNPDIYTREFVELVRRMNQLVRGKMGAFSSFRDVLAGEMEKALPEVREDVRRVLEATGGGGPGEVKEEGGVKREGV